MIVPGNGASAEQFYPVLASHSRMSSRGVPWVASIAKSCIGVQACIILLLWSDWMGIQYGLLEWHAMVNSLSTIG